MFPPHHCMRNSCGSQTRAPNNPKGIGASSPRLARNAYLGCAFGNRINANGVVAEVRRARAGTDGPQPRCGWGCFSDDDPRVARASQPWALGQNPGGILERSATLRVAAGSPARRWLDVSAATLHAEVLRVADMLNDGRARIPKSR